jgi:M6 family metalloprotease-like protein
MRHALAVAVLLGIGCSSSQKVDPALLKMPEFRTVETAVTTTVQKGAAAATTGQAGYLGVTLASDHGRVVVADVAADSPATKAGLLAGDVLLDFTDAEQFRAHVQAVTPGETLKFSIDRKGEEKEIAAVVGAVSRPMKLAERRALLGITLGDANEGGGAPITRVTNGSAAEKAGLKNGDIILKIDGAPMTSAARLTDAVSEKKPGDTVVLTLQRGATHEDLKVTLGEDTAGNARDAGYNRGGQMWRKDLYRVAVIPVEYPDVKHNAKIGLKDWEESYFSKGTYDKKSNVTGQPVHGSLNDYYQEQSYGALRVEGKVFDWVEVAKKRAEYGPATAQNEKSVFFTEALDKLLARDGADTIKDFDGVFFLYAGDRVNTTRGGLYWPHRGNVTYKGRRISYFIVQEGGTKMGSISVTAHEFGHMLGLPDLYARPENPGSEGLGVWCAMSNELGNGRPQHFGAWCKEQLGWIKPAVIDPTVKQRLVLAPMEDSPKECFKVLLRPDGSEYFLLENRRKKGFDADLPAEGLLIWRVVRSRPILEESHGVEGAAGPNVFRDSIPYPSKANDSFTPFTTPSSRSQLGGGLPVHITNIRRLPDGKISFSIGYEYE